VRILPASEYVDRIEDGMRVETHRLDVGFCGLFGPFGRWGGFRWSRSTSDDATTDSTVAQNEQPTVLGTAV
jgi:hypothetical protein